MSTNVVTATMPDQRTVPSALFSLGAVLAVLGSLGFISMNGLPPREAFAHPVGVAGSALAAVGCLVLSLALVQWRSPLPRWAVLTSAAGVWVAGATAWAQSTFVVAAATKTDNQLFDTLFFESPWVLGGMLPKSLLCLVGFLGIAISGWRRRSIPRSAAGAFALAGLLSLWPPFPPGLIVASVALLVISRTDRGASG